MSKKLLIVGTAFGLLGAALVALRCKKEGNKRKTAITVSQLWVYPIKSCSGCSVKEVQVTDQGFKFDRAWAVFRTSNNNIVTQRDVSAMKIIFPKIDEANGYLSLTFEGETVTVPLSPQSSVELGPLLTLSAANIRGLDGANVRHQGAEVSEALSRWLGEQVYLGRIEHSVRIPQKSKLDTALCNGTESILLQDFATLTVCSEEGFEYLRRGMHVEHINSQHFRPNIVVQGTCYPDEDTWGTFTVGSILIRTARWCSRCVMPNIDDDGKKNEQCKPTDYLKSTRLATFPHRGTESEQKPMFGLSVFHEGTGVIHLGDEVVVTGRKEAPIWIGA